jgi:hypothetical protein
LVDSLVASNIATGTLAYGGGLYSEGNLNLTRTTLSANLAYRGGGGVYVGGATTLREVTLRGNRTLERYGYRGGGIYNFAVLNIYDTLLGDNTAGHYGGGIFNQSSVYLEDVTLSNNHAQFGGGIFNVNTLSMN